ncbi:winged helix domain-containing protein [Sinorhizobium meliloti]|uniref:winged helix domain-containing protein n=1 Tax=Rhizobium meliloti TaxID=382 RepID=UPI000FDA3E1B|nr:hypothetical protein [Sinorhizobium meliloti]MDW9711865.1 hypothetical protein [Sinorhizobium meliloti]MDW9749307.1 hypothetical protein [Sinorhizobium meliloti]MQX63626.1 hypothetical protein [Sinorhizobium meliloti]MQX63727.1 hypothetical protein [Sinorhizobium meliloti]RVE81312.1 hypothetical protein CN240_15610 [Sinorhizobium meliloti]
MTQVLSRSQRNIRVNVLNDNNEPCGLPVTFVGREAYTLRKLLDAGDRGISSLDHVGIRLAHYCMKIRRAGIVIETVKTPQRGEYRGWYGIYKLRSRLSVLEDNTRAAA